MSFEGSPAQQFPGLFCDRADVTVALREAGALPAIDAAVLAAAIRGGALADHVGQAATENPGR